MAQEELRRSKRWQRFEVDSGEKGTQPNIEWPPNAILLGAFADAESCLVDSHQLQSEVPPGIDESLRHLARHAAGSDQSVLVSDTFRGRSALD